MTIKYSKNGLRPLKGLAKARLVSDTSKQQIKRQFINRQDSLLTLINMGVVDRIEGKFALKLRSAYLQINGSEGLTSMAFKGSKKEFILNKKTGIRKSKKHDAILSLSLWQKRMAELGGDSHICKMVLWENKSLREIDKEKKKRSGWARRRFKQGIMCFGSIIETSPSNL